MNKLVIVLEPRHDLSFREFQQLQTNSYDIRSQQFLDQYQGFFRQQCVVW